jgi:parvulin-like peptidyl-prolyl isomerase
VALLATIAGAEVNRIVLRVNDQIATLYEFEQRRFSRIQEIQRANLPPERRQRLLADVGLQTMREMFDELLLLSRADQLDVRISDREVEAAVAETRASFGIETDEEFLAALNAAGMDVDDLRAQMRRNLMIREVMGREVQQKIELEEEDLRRYYRDHPDEFSVPRRLQVREVVIPDGAAADPDARSALAAEARMALLAGEEGSDQLAQLAAEGKATGILDLGWVERGDLGATLEREIWDLEPGAVSEPIATRGGLHVVEVMAEEPARLQPFGDVQDQIRNKLRAGRYQEEMADFLTQLESSSYVVLNPPPEAAGFRTAGAGDRQDELIGLGLAPEDAGGAEPESDPEGESDPAGEATEPPD